MITRTNRTLQRLDEMLSEAINGTFEESRYDETELSRLESRWKQYLSSSKMSMEQTEKERESMKALVSDISHQTRTPLANILLYAQLLEEQTENETEKALAEQILTQTEKLEFLIQSLVKLSRLESDVLELVPVCQKLKPMVMDCLMQVKNKAQKKGIRINVHFPREEAGQEVQAVYDRKWTTEALFNVLDNAVKYSPEDTEVQVEVKEYEFYVCICVTDQGMGIREEEKAKIFTRFYRSSQVQQEDGVGIGLHLARTILEKEKGYIKVNSKEREGSAFGIYLPRK